MKVSDGKIRVLSVSGSTFGQKVYIYKDDLFCGLEEFLADSMTQSVYVSTQNKNVLKHRKIGTCGNEYLYDIAVWDTMYQLGVWYQYKGDFNYCKIINVSCDITTGKYYMVGNLNIVKNILKKYELAIKLTLK